VSNLIVTKALLGTDEASIDDKGRILVGKKKRERLGEPFVVALGETGCLVAYPQETWQALLNEIFSVPSINVGRQQYSRLILGTADDDLRFDSQGRVVIPHKLREAAQLKDKVLLIGCGDRLEIWDLHAYAEFCRDPESFGSTRRTAIEQAYRQMTGGFTHDGHGG
jgi:MraZ protein